MIVSTFCTMNWSAFHCPCFSEPPPSALLAFDDSGWVRVLFPYRELYTTDVFLWIFARPEEPLFYIFMSNIVFLQGLLFKWKLYIRVQQTVSVLKTSVVSPHPSSNLLFLRLFHTVKTGIILLLFLFLLGCMVRCWKALKSLFCVCIKTAEQLSDRNGEMFFSFTCAFNWLKGDLTLIKLLFFFHCCSKVHAWGHTIRQKGLPGVRDRLGNSASRVPSSWHPSHHLIPHLEPAETPHAALPVSARWQEVHTTQDVLRYPSHDHGRPWEQVGDARIHNVVSATSSLRFCSFSNRQIHVQCC